MIYTAIDTFYLTPAQLEDSPSRKDGIDADVETTLRIYGAEIIQEAGILLRLPQVVMATGQVLLHRFFAKQSFCRYNVKRVASSCLWVASKLEETPRRIRDILFVFHRIDQRREGLPIEPLEQFSKAYDDLRVELIRMERHLLKEMGFICHVEHPHKFIPIYLEQLGVQVREVQQQTWSLANDSLRTTLCIRFRSEVVACGVIYAATRRARIPLPENPPWWLIFDATKEQIDEVCRELADLYQRPKATYQEVGKEHSTILATRAWEPAPAPSKRMASKSPTPPPLANGATGNKEKGVECSADGDDKGQWGGMVTGAGDKRREGRERSKESEEGPSPMDVEGKLPGSGSESPLEEAYKKGKGGRRCRVQGGAGSPMGEDEEGEGEREEEGEEGEKEGGKRRGRGEGEKGGVLSGGEEEEEDDEVEEALRIEDAGEDWVIPQADPYEALISRKRRDPTSKGKGRGSGGEETGGGREAEETMPEEIMKRRRKREGSGRREEEGEDDEEDGDAEGGSRALPRGSSPRDGRKEGRGGRRGEGRGTVTYDVFERARKKKQQQLRESELEARSSEARGREQRPSPHFRDGGRDYGERERGYAGGSSSLGAKDRERRAGGEVDRGGPGYAPGRPPPKEGPRGREYGGGRWGGGGRGQGREYGYSGDGKRGGYDAYEKRPSRPEGRDSRERDYRDGVRGPSRGPYRGR